MKKPHGPSHDDSAQGILDIAAIDQVANIVSKYDLSEVEVDVGEIRVRIVRERKVASAGALEAPARAAAGPPAEAPEKEPVPSTETVKSPMVGTAYLRPSPEAKPFVEVGSVVKSGDKLLLVEAMKTFNDILSPRGGKILEILVGDGSPVEYGQALMVIE